MTRIKRIRSHTGHAQFLAQCLEEPVREIPRDESIPSPYHFSSTHSVWNWNGVDVIIVETAHRCFDVFRVEA